MGKEPVISRGEIFRYVKKMYGTEPEYPWMKYPCYAVLRHADNSKWYGLVMRAERHKLRLDGDGWEEIMNVKCDPAMIGSLRMKEGILPAYHMNRAYWVSVLLDGSVERELAFSLLDMSFGLTSDRQGRGNSRYGRNTEWLIPANPKVYDLEQDFKAYGEILWKQQNRVAVGDKVYIYMAAPSSEIQYKCEVAETDIPYGTKGENPTVAKAMRLKLLKRYDKISISREMMKNHGVYAVRSPRGIPRSLVEEIERLYR